MFVASSRMQLMLEWHMLEAAIAQNVPVMRYNLALTSLHYISIIYYGAGLWN